MRLEKIDDVYVYFTYDIACLGDVDTIDEEKIGIFLKKVFLDINDIYNVNLFGYFHVNIYVDEKLGSFTEITKIDDFVNYNKKIDTKVSFSVNHFYLKTKDLSKIIKYRPIYSSNNYYVISTDSVDNILDILEFCEVEYRELKNKELLFDKNS